MSGESDDQTLPAGVLGYMQWHHLPLSLVCTVSGRVVRATVENVPGASPELRLTVEDLGPVGRAQVTR